MLISFDILRAFALFLNSWYTGKMLGYSSFKQLSDVTSSYCSALIITLSVYFLKYLPVSYWLILLFQVVIGFVVLITICEIVKQTEYLEIKNMILRLITN